MAALIRSLLKDAGYEEMVKNDEDTSNRWSNLCEFVSLAERYHVSELDDFLDQIQLVSDVDALDAQGASRGPSVPVTLSTIHGAKGLEFDHVFVCGVEEGLFPHFYSSDDSLQIDEERRLLYVAITRARFSVSLSHARSRGRYGKIHFVDPSRFLDDLPPTLPKRDISATNLHSGRVRLYPHNGFKSIV